MFLLQRYTFFLREQCQKGLFRDKSRRFNIF